MNKGKVLMAAPVHPVLTEGLEAAGYELLRFEQIEQGAAMALVPECVGIILSTRLIVNRAMMDAAPHLRWIGRMGSGMEIIDLPYAASRGIACFSSPGGNCNAVAEHAMGLLLGLTKHIASSAIEVAEGKWLREENRGTELEGKTIGIIGYGHTGSAFARKLMGFDVNVLAYDIAADTGMPLYPHVTLCSSLQPLYEQADVISFHVPLNAGTKHYFNTAFLEQMQRPFILLNTSRGKVVDAVALKQGLAGEKITAAGIDVWMEEPMAAMSAPVRELLTTIAALPQTIVTPHIGGYTKEALYKMSRLLLEQILTVQ